MQSLKFKNKDDILEIGYQPPYALADLTGITDIPLVSTTSKGFNQQGMTTTSQSFNQREILVSVNIIGNSMKDVYEKRQRLIGFLNPTKGEFDIIYTNDFTCKVITGKIFSMPKSESVEGGLSNVQKVSFLIICDDPFWRDIDESFFRLTVVEPMFSFPLDINEEGICFGEMRNKRSTVLNKGDVDTSIRIEWIGNVENPVITNEDTKEKILVRTKIKKGEKLVIDTGYKNKRVFLERENGSCINAFGMMDLSSEFFSLKPGYNTINYDAESGAESSSVIVKFKQRYIGV